MVTSHDIDVKRRIKDACNIVDYIGREFQLRRQGAIYTCHCPFHDDTRPSLQINPVRQSWACWVCNIRGDIFSWVMRRENVGFREALEQLAEFTGIELSQAPRRYEKQSPEDKQWLFKAARWAEEEFHRMLLESDAAAPARGYLNDRGISQQSIEDFQLGFSPASFTWLVDRGAKSPFSPKVLEAIGLIATSKRGSWYDRFRGRLIFPIRDTSQRSIAFGGRVVPGLFPPDQEPPGKYINSPETRLFSKSETLYNLNLVRDVIAKDKVRRLTVVEGYTDVIGAWQTGMKNTVACLGTALNERHLRVIRRFADQITLVLDGDDAGQRRANEILDLFVSQDVDLRILTLPEGLDPFDYVMENGSEPFQQMIDGAPDAIEHRIRTETSGIDVLNDTHSANQALERILQTLSRAPDSLVSGSAAKRLRQDQILSRVSRKFSLDVDQLRRRLAEIRSAGQRRFDSYITGEQQAAPEKPFDPLALDRKEFELLQLMLGDSELIDIAIENVAPDQFNDGPLKDIYLAALDLYHDGVEAGYEDLILSMEDGSETLRNILFYMQDEAEQKKATAENATEKPPTDREQIETIIEAFNNIDAETGKRALISSFEQRELDEQEEARKLEELLNETRRRQGLSAPMDG